MDHFSPSGLRYLRRRMAEMGSSSPCIDPPTQIRHGGGSITLPWGWAGPEASSPDSASLMGGFWRQAGACSPVELLHLLIVAGFALLFARRLLLSLCHCQGLSPSMRAFPPTIPPSRTFYCISAPAQDILLAFCCTLAASLLSRAPQSHCSGAWDLVISLAPFLLLLASFKAPRRPPRGDSKMGIPGVCSSSSSSPSFSSSSSSPSSSLRHVRSTCSGRQRRGGEGSPTVGGGDEWRRRGGRVDQLANTRRALAAVSAVALYAIESVCATSSSPSLVSSPLALPPSSGGGAACFPLLCGPNASFPPAGAMCWDAPQGGLREVTVGTLSSFAIDAFLGQISSWGGEGGGVWDIFGAGGDLGGRLVAAMSPGGGDVVSVEATVAGLQVGVRGGQGGVHTLAVGVAFQGGLLGAYHSDAAMGGEADYTRVDPEVDVVFGGGRDAVLAAGAGGVRWCGFIAPLEEDPGRDTFDGGVADYILRVTSRGGRARLWLNGTLVAETPDHGGDAVARNGVPLTPRTLTSVSLEWVGSASWGKGERSMRLLWQAPQVPLGVVPSDRLFSAKRAALPVSVRVLPGQPTSAELAEFPGGNGRFQAGARVPFTVHARDAAGNSAASPPGGAVLATLQSNDSQGSGATTSDLLNAGEGTFGGAFPAGVTKAGTAMLAAYNAVVGGLAATYYSGRELEIPAKFQAADGPLAFSAGQGGLSWVPCLEGVGSGGAGFGAVYAGFVRPPAAGEYTLTATVGQASERVRVWVDGRVIIDQWGSLAGLGSAGAVSLPSASDQYHVRVAYRETGGGALAGAGLGLEWETGSLSKELIPSGRLSAAYLLTEAALTIGPAPVDAAASTFAAATVVSAGGVATFSIQARDSYGNDAATGHVEAWLQEGTTRWTVQPTGLEPHPPCPTRLSFPGSCLVPLPIARAI